MIFDTLRGGHVIKVNVLYKICMVLYAPRDTLGGPMWPNVYVLYRKCIVFVCSRGHPWGAYVAQVYVLYRKCIVLYHPGTKIFDFAMENGPQRGAASQSHLG